jgi:hypothetical protein
MIGIPKPARASPEFPADLPTVLLAADAAALGLPAAVALLLGGHFRGHRLPSRFQKRRRDFLLGCPCAGEFAKLYNNRSPLPREAGSPSKYIDAFVLFTRPL